MVCPCQARGGRKGRGRGWREGVPELTMCGHDHGSVYSAGPVFHVNTKMSVKQEKTRTIMLSSLSKLIKEFLCFKTNAVFVCMCNMTKTNV